MNENTTVKSHYIKNTFISIHFFFFKNVSNLHTLGL